MEAAYIIVKDYDTIIRSDTSVALGGPELGNWANSFITAFMNS